MISKTSYFQFNLQIFRHFNKNNTHRIVVTGSPKGYENLATGYCKIKIKKLTIPHALYIQ
jgi:hypothetical protein